MEELSVFILTFMGVLAVYLIFIFIPNKRRYDKKDMDKQPMEIKLLENLYKVNIKKTNYQALLLLICIVSSFDIALIVSVVAMLKSFILEVLIGVILIIVMIFVSYYPIGLYYKKRGKTKCTTTKK
ncbi:MAG: hypothetical protein IJH18_00545 [Bacilli bacterium]|nr:hypothetical protein [Bacilli bacterium]